MSEKRSLLWPGVRRRRLDETKAGLSALVSRFRDNEWLASQESVVQALDDLENVINDEALKHIDVAKVVDHLKSLIAAAKQAELQEAAASLVSGWDGAPPARRAVEGNANRSKAEQPDVPPPEDVPPPRPQTALPDGPPPPNDIPPLPKTTQEWMGSAPPTTSAPTLPAAVPSPLDGTLPPTDVPPPVRADVTTDYKLARQLADELQRVVDAYVPGADVVAVKRRRGGGNDTSARIDMSRKRSPLLASGRRAQLADTKAALIEITGEIGDNDLLMGNERVRRAVHELQQRFLYNEKLERLDPEQVVNLFKMVIAATKDVPLLQPVNEEVDKTLALPFAATDAALARHIFAPGGRSEAAKAFKPIAKAVDSDAADPSGSASPMQATAAQLRPLLVKLSGWGSVDNTKATLPSAVIDRARRFNGMLHDHLSAFLSFQNTYDSSTGIVSKITRLIIWPELLLVQLTGRSSEGKLDNFKKACAETVQSLGEGWRSLLALGQELSNFAKQDGLNEEEKALVGEMSNLLTTFARQSLQPDSPYMGLYQFAARVTSGDDARAQQLLDEALKALKPDA